MGEENTQGTHNLQFHFHDRLCHEKIKIICRWCVPYALPPCHTLPLPTPCPPGSEFFMGILSNNRHDRLCHGKIKITKIYRWCVLCGPPCPILPPAYPGPPESEFLIEI